MKPERRARSRAESFRHAFQGWRHLLWTQPNARIHAGITVAVILLGAWLVRSLTDWGLLLMAIALVWSAEFFNTAVEAVVDLASPELHPLAGIAKDLGAAAVLLNAIAAALIGLLVFGPPLWLRFTGG